MDNWWNEQKEDLGRNWHYLQGIGVKMTFLKYLVMA